jgi:putative redox protein
MTSSIVYEGDLRTRATHLQSGTSIETDAPVDNQGKGERFSPTDLVATALGTCMMTIMGIKSRDLGIDLTGVKIDIQKHMLPDPRRIGGVDLHFQFPAHILLSDKDKTILERAAMTCPVFESLNPAMEVKVRWEW